MNAELHRIAGECSARHSAQVIDVVVRGSKQKAVVEIFIDAESGVTSDMCSAVSRDVAEELDARNILRGAYELVVSSPGIDRPLKFAWQYKKHVGRKLAVATHTEPVRRIVGTLVAADDNGFSIEAGGERQDIRFETVREAVVQSPW